MAYEAVICGNNFPVLGAKHLYIYMGHWKQDKARALQNLSIQGAK